MNKASLKTLAAVALISVAVNAFAGNTTEECNSGAYEISGVLTTPNGNPVEAAVIVNGCYTFSDKKDGSYRLRFKYLYEEVGKEVSALIFAVSYRNHTPPPMSIGNGAIRYDVTLKSEEQGGGGECRNFKVPGASVAQWIYSPKPINKYHWTDFVPKLMVNEGYEMVYESPTGAIVMGRKDIVFDDYGNSAPEYMTAAFADGLLSNCPSYIFYVGAGPSYGALESTIKSLYNQTESVINP